MLPHSCVVDWMLAGVVAIAAAALNNALHAVPPERRGPVVNTGVALAGIGAAVWVVLRGEPTVGLGAGLVWTAGAAAVVAAVALAARLAPAVGRALADPRMAAMPGPAFARHVWLRIPLLSALAEELLFRGLVFGLLDRAGGTGWALVGSAVAFAASHVAVGADQARQRGTATGRWVAVTVAATFGAGLALGALRAGTGGVWAPAGVHAVVNAGLAVVARRHGAVRPTAPGTG